MNIVAQQRAGLREEIDLANGQLWRQWLSPQPDEQVIARLQAHIAYCESRIELLRSS